MALRSGEAIALKWRPFMQDDSVKVKFDGDISGVDINTFTRVLLDYSTVIQESALEIDPSARLSIEITGAGHGCLEAFLHLAPTVGKGLIDTVKSVAPELPEIIDAASELYDLMHKVSKLGGVESTSSDGKTVTVRAKNGNVINVSQTTYKIYAGNGDAPTAVRKTFETLAHEDGITGVSIQPCSNEVESVSIPSSDFETVANAPQPPVEKKVGVFHRQTLAIVRAMFVQSKTRKWSFEWKGATISAPITDDTFFERFPGMSFKLGDSLIADLKVEQRLDEKSGLYVNSSYEVVKVHAKDELPRTEQLDI
jgi:hypothetical protein